MLKQRLNRKFWFPAHTVKASKIPKTAILKRFLDFFSTTQNFKAETESKTNLVKMPSVFPDENVPIKAKSHLVSPKPRTF